MDKQNELAVEVAFALPDCQEIIELVVSKGCTALEAVEKSGLLEKYSEIDVENLELGIFSRHLNGVEMPMPADYVLEDEDRVEIYRPLLMDPKQARLERLQKSQQKSKEKTLKN